MKLYVNPISVTSRPLMLFAAQERLDVEFEHVDLVSGAHHAEWFSELNPNRLVPVLVDGDFVLTESATILRYLAESNRSASYPQSLRARARVDERMDWFNTQFYREFGYGLVYPQIFGHHRRPDPSAQAHVLEWARERAASALEILDARLIGSQRFVAGEEITIADYFGACLLTAGDHIQQRYAAYPNVQRWLETMRALEQWDAVHEVHDGFAASLSDRDFVRV